MKLIIRSLLLVLILFSLSCEKSMLGENLLSDEDKLRGTFTDTAKIISQVVVDPAVRSDRLLQNQLGSMNDPIFGKTTAGMIVEFGLPFIGITDTVGGYQLDSIVLTLQLNSFYGDTTIPQTFIVYKLLDKYNKNQTYFSNLNPNISMVEVGRVENILFKPNSTTLIDGQPSNIRRIKIRLSDLFGASLINHLGTEAMSSNANFEQFLPGLYIVPDTTSFGGGIATFNLNSLVSNMALYYKNKN